MITKDQSHDRWKLANHNAYATDHWDWTFYICKLFHDLAIPRTSEILELGCNVGRNLEGLRQCHYEYLSGVDINPNTISHRERHFPLLFGRFYYSPLEEFDPGNKKWDVIYTSAHFEHIHPDSAYVFERIPDWLNPNGYIITNEDEHNHEGLDFVFARSYENIFPGLKQIHYEEPPASSGYKRGYVTRVHQKPC